MALLASSCTAQRATITRPLDGAEPNTAEAVMTFLAIYWITTSSPVRRVEKFMVWQRNAQSAASLCTLSPYYQLHAVSLPCACSSDLLILSGHVFHTRCVLSSLHREKKCPSCRTTVIDTQPWQVRGLGPQPETTCHRGCKRKASCLEEPRHVATEGGSDLSSQYSAP